LKLILEVYETFTYPSREGRARNIARSYDTQAVSLLYLQTTYRVLPVHYYVNIINCTLYIHSLPLLPRSSSYVVWYHTIWFSHEVQPNTIFVSCFYVLPQVVRFYEDLSCLGYDSV